MHVFPRTIGRILMSSLFFSSISKPSFSSDYSDGYEKLISKKGGLEIDFLHGLRMTKVWQRSGDMVVACKIIISGRTFYFIFTPMIFLIIEINCHQKFYIICTSNELKSKTIITSLAIYECAVKLPIAKITYYAPLK